jgi:hypothetical protein
LDNIMLLTLAAAALLLSQRSKWQCSDRYSYLASSDPWGLEPNKEFRGCLAEYLGRLKHVAVGVGTAIAGAAFDNLVISDDKPIPTYQTLACKAMSVKRICSIWLSLTVILTLRTWWSRLEVQPIFAPNVVTGLAILLELLADVLITNDSGHAL